MQPSFALGAVVSLLSAVAHADERCAALSNSKLFADTIVSSAVAVAATNGVPEFCEVTVTISPVKGSAIGAVYRLPMQWNGKVLGLGGSGWMGVTQLASATRALARGYATMQTDSGHPIASGFDTRWAIDANGKPNKVAIEDFGYRAVHAMTDIGKQVIKTYYGRGHDHAYWQGCSTGGRQGFMEVQRYPNDYDGVIAGAPVYDLLTTTGALVRYNNFAAPARRLTEGHLELINRAVVKACDAIDGREDGIIVDPRACTWDPAALQCHTDASGHQCLTAAQVDAVRLAYAGVKSRDGKVAAYPLSRGSETGWQRFAFATEDAPGDAASVGMSGLRGAFFESAQYDLRRFDINRDVARVRSSLLAKTYEAVDLNISTFVGRGGKLIIWHGFYDPGPGPTGTIDYYEKAKRATKASEGIDQSVRLFLAPGVAHCGGGPGPDQVDFLSALENWVERGRAPDSLAATKKDSTLTFSLCPYPTLPSGIAGRCGDKQ